MMKQQQFIYAILFLLTGQFVFAQVGGNVIYDKSNRYMQNASYNEEEIDLFQETRGINYHEIIQEREITFQVNALKNVKATSFLAIFNVIQVAPTASKADSLLNIRFDRLRRELQDIGVGEKNMYVDMVSLIPLYEYEIQKKLFSKSYNEVPAGFELQKNIHISYKNARDLDKILTLAAKNEIYDLVKVEYFAENPEPVYDDLRKQSIALLRRKIDSYEVLGFKLDTVYHVFSESKSVAYPIDRYRDYQAFSGASLEAANKSSVTTVRKPKSMFYNKISYHTFDIVINPEILEPVIQYAYQISIKYVLNEPKAEVVKRYFFIDKNGNIKPFNY